MTKFCPLIKGPCKETECAWYDSDENCCGILELAYSLFNIHEAMYKDEE